MGHKTISGEQLEEEKRVFTIQRDKALERFNEKIKEGKDWESTYKALIRIHKQWLLLDDALIITVLKHSRKND